MSSDDPPSTFRHKGVKYGVKFNGEWQALAPEFGGKQLISPLELHGNEAELKIKNSDVRLGVRIEHRPTFKTTEVVTSKLEPADTHPDDGLRFVRHTDNEYLPRDTTVTFVDVGPQSETPPGAPDYCEYCPENGRDEDPNLPTHSLLAEGDGEAVVRYICEDCIDDEDIHNLPSLDPL